MWCVAVPETSGRLLFIERLRCSPACRVIALNENFATMHQNMAFAVAQGTFEGPLGLLLELIEKAELQITDVSLAKVAEDYLAYIDSHEVPPAEMADFLLVATRLIYLKSRELLPFLQTPDEDASAERLKDQLRIYREYAQAAERLQKLYGGQLLVPRPFVVRVRDTTPQFAPASNVTMQALNESFKGMLKRLQPFFALQETSMERTKSVEERLREMTEALRTRASMSFHEVVRGAGSKMEVVVSFLALLELLRRRVVVARQSDSFGEIELEHAQ